MSFDAPTWESTREPVPQTLRRVLEWLYVKNQADQLVARANQLREEVTKTVRDSADAYADDRGNVFLNLPERLTVGDKTYEAVKRERRILRIANEDRIRILADRTGTTDRLFPPQPVLDEQELYVLYQEGLITEADIDGSYDIKESWALKAVAV